MKDQTDSTYFFDANRVGIWFDFDFDAIHQTFQLVANVSSSFHRTMLDKILVTPLCWIIRIFPLEYKKKIGLKWYSR